MLAGLVHFDPYVYFAGTHYCLYLAYCFQLGPILYKSLVLTRLLVNYLRRYWHMTSLKSLVTADPGKGHFFSNIYQKRNRNKKNKKGNQNNNITFKRLLIFPFRYIAEKKLKQDYWKGNQNNKYLVLST